MSDIHELFHPEPNDEHWQFATADAAHVGVRALNALATAIQREDHRPAREALLMVADELSVRILAALERLRDQGKAA